MQSPHPRIVLGGLAKKRSAALAARHADEYNQLYVPPDAAREGADRLRAACEAAGRDPATLRLSLMTGFVIGADDAEVRARAGRIMEANGEEGDVDAWLRVRADEQHWLVGTPEQVVERLHEYAEAGIARVALQHHAFQDLDVLALIGRDVLPAVDR